MSILDQTPEEIKTPAERRADTIRQHVRQTAKVLVDRWAQGFDQLWRRTDPEATLAALGTDAGEIFDRSKALHEYCIAQYGIDHPIIIQEVLPRLQSLPEIVRHDDGTVTAIFPETEPAEDAPIQEGV